MKALTEKQIMKNMIENISLILQRLSAVLLQNEATQDYKSTMQHQTERKPNGVRFDNPVFLQCNSTGQRQSVFWYPYVSDTNASNSNDMVQHSPSQKKNQKNVTFSSFQSAQSEFIKTDCLKDKKAEEQK